ncbi:MAG: bile acid:sodium symporter family protein [Pseudomonadota bacterium]
MILDIALPLSLAFIMFSLGLGLTVQDFVRVFETPRAFITGAICQLVALPLIAWGLVALAGLPPALSFGVMILAFCPGGVTSNMMTKLARGTVALSISLTGVISLVSVLTIPWLVNAAAQHFLGPEALTINVTQLGLVMFGMTALPVTIGIALHRYFPVFSRRAEPKVSALATALFVGIVILSIGINWQLLVENFLRLGPVLVGFNIILFGVGILAARLTGLNHPTQTAIAIETGIQNSALGIALATLIASASTTGGTGGGIPAYALPAAVYGITFYAVAAPFIWWARRRG